MHSLSPILALAIGAVLSPWLSSYSWLIPHIIAGMLLLTFVGVSPKQVRLQWEHLFLLILQVALSLVGYYICKGLGEVYAQSVMLCVLMPAATAIPTVVAMLRGDLGFSTSYVLLSHTFVTLLAPLILPYVNGGAEVSFWSGVWGIFRTVSPLVLIPIALAWLLRWSMAGLCLWVQRHAWMSFALWLLSLVLLMSHTIDYIYSHPAVSAQDVIYLLLTGGIICILQFVLGDKLSVCCRVEPHALRHALGQRNTTLGIWLALLYLDPLSTLSVSGYIIAQNILISYYLWYYNQHQYE